MEMLLEVVFVPVSDVQKSKDFYEHKVGFKVDFQFGENGQPDGPLQLVQLTPPGSACSIHIGKGIVDMKPGSIKSLILVVDSAEKAKKELEAKGLRVGDIQKMPWGKQADFSDPDGNSWTLQESYARTKQKAKQQ
jgi:catechol 2,3-dioxygenase-like lactoylglutathione lyase family enzyme